MTWRNTLGDSPVSLPFMVVKAKGDSLAKPMRMNPALRAFSSVDSAWAETAASVSAARAIAEKTLRKIFLLQSMDSPLWSFVLWAMLPFAATSGCAGIAVGDVASPIARCLDRWHVMVACTLTHRNTHVKNGKLRLRQC